MSIGSLPQYGLATLVVIVLGSTLCEANGPWGRHTNFHPGDVLFPGQELTNNLGEYGGLLYMQEIAVLDITCRDKTGAYIYQLDENFYEARWVLAFNQIAESNAVPADPDLFPITLNREQYHSTQVDDNPNYSFLRRMAKFTSTIRYTARMEDHNKIITCHQNAKDYEWEFRGTGFQLKITPAPTPVMLKNTIERSWKGGFSGQVVVPISDYFNAWKMILKFNKKVFEFFGGAIVEDENICLHVPDDCGYNSKTYRVIHNSYGNRLLNAGDELKITCVAGVAKGVHYGLKAEVMFYGYNQVFFTKNEYPVYNPFNPAPETAAVAT